MRKISYYLMVVVLLGVSVVSYWIYQKYFKVEDQTILVFQALRGDIRETVKARGEVVAQKEFDLEFPFTGTIERVLVKEGQQVQTGDALLKLETKELELERVRLQAAVVQSEATLTKLLGGATGEDVRVSETKVLNAEQARLEAHKALVDASATAFTQADDAIHNKADQFFNNPRSSSPSINLIVADSQLKVRLETDRFIAESMLNSWTSSLPTETVKKNLAFVKSFLLDVAAAVNSSGASVSVAQTTFDGWKANISAARTSIDAATTALVTAEERVRTAESALTLAQSELALKQSKPRDEDVTIARAQIDQSKSTLASVDEKIRKSTLRAPGTGVVKKVYLEERETFNPGMSALSFSSDGYKIRADISELDISKVRYKNGNDVLIRLDAFPDMTFRGKVVFIEPQEIFKDEDVYFRTDIFLEQNGKDIRSGMSADLVLYGVAKKDVLRVPELAVYRKGEKTFVKVARGVVRKDEVRPNNLTEVEVVTGVSDGELVEIVQGLQDNEFVVVSAE